MNYALTSHWKNFRRPHKIAKHLLWSAAGAMALGGILPWRFEDHWLRIERRDMPLPHLGSDFAGATIALISDVHCSPVVIRKYLRQCVEAINQLNPDFVAITGDFITGRWRHARKVAEILSGLNPKIATLACLGNHDYGIYHPTGRGYIDGLSEYITELLTRADIFVMRNEQRIFRRGNSTLQFVGMEDYWTREYDPIEAFELTYDDLPTIALSHNPDSALDVAGQGAHCILAGHTHGGDWKRSALRQVLCAVTQSDFTAGHYELGDEKYLYVNRGLSYGRRNRINPRPEITLFTLRQAEA